MLETGYSHAKPARILTPLRIVSTLVLTLALSISTQVASAQAPACKPLAYTFVTLSAPFPGTDQTLAYGINDLGMVVGDYHDTNGSHGFVYNGSTYTPINVSLPGARDTVATGINIFQQIVGNYDTPGITHGFELSNGKFTSIDYPAAGVIATFARSINALGQIAGSYVDGTGSHGFFLSQGKFTAINVPLANVTWTQALGINDRSEIVGSYGTSDGKIHAFGRSGSGFIQGYDVPPAGSVQSLAYAVNNREQVAGANFLYDSGVTFTLTELNPSAVNASASGVNDLGQMVGIYGESSEMAFLMTPK